MAIEKTKRITVRYEPDDYKFILKKADQAGLQKSTYVREVSLENISQDPEKFSKYDLVNELKGFRKEILSLGNNLNQLARVANTTGSVNPERVEDMRSLLIDLSNRVQNSLK